MEGQCPVFTYTSRDFVRDVTRTDGETTMSRFDETLRSGWVEKMGRGMFRYHLGKLETRILSGEEGYVAQLNIQRGIERRKPQEILSIRQNFDPKQFNFTKISPDEVLFDMCRHDPNSSESCSQNCTTDPNSSESCSQNGTADPRCLVIINVSPLEFGHSLLVPEPMRCHPQILTPPAVQVGIESVFLSSHPGYRVGFNSMGGFASVNHLHLHAYYLDHPLRVEWAPVQPVAPEGGLYRLSGFPNGFMFYTEGQDPGGTAEAVCRLTDALVDRNIAHNMFLTRGCPPCAPTGPCGPRRGVRIVVWPRVSCFGAKEESAFNVALCELAGHLPFKNQQDFTHTDEDGVKAIVRKYAFNDHQFEELHKHLVGQLYKVNKSTD